MLINTQFGQKFVDTRFLSPRLTLLLWGNVLPLFHPSLKLSTVKSFFQEKPHLFGFIHDSPKGLLGHSFMVLFKILILISRFLTFLILMALGTSIISLSLFQVTSSSLLIVYHWLLIHPKRTKILGAAAIMVPLSSPMSTDILTVPPSLNLAFSGFGSFIAILGLDSSFGSLSQMPSLSIPTFLFVAFPYKISILSVVPQMNLLNIFLDSVAPQSF